MDKKRALFIVALMIFLLDFGVGFNNPLFGAGWPEMHKFLGVDMSVGGTVPVFLAIGMVLSITNSERFQIKIGTFKMLILSVIFICIAMTGYAFAKWFPLVVIMAFIQGMGCGINATVTNGFFVRNLESRYMNWLHCVWSIGATTGPVIMSWFILNQGNYRFGFMLASGIQIIIILFLISSKSLWGKTGDLYSQKDASIEKKQAMGLLKAIKVPGAAQASLAIFFYVSLEMTVATWSSSYLVVIKNISEGDAAGWSAVIYIGITVSRFLGGFVVKKLGNKGLIYIGVAFAFCGLILIVFSNTQAPLIAGFLTLGLGFGPILPCQIHATKENFGEKNVQAIVNTQAAAQGTGFAIFPFLFGRIAGITGYGFFPYILLGILIAYFVSIYFLFKIARRTRNAESATVNNSSEEI